MAKGWYDGGYIFPEGYVSQLAFRSSVELDQTCVHVCSIIGFGGQHWPAPTFKITALDREDAPLFGKSCTACWTQVGWPEREACELPDAWSCVQQAQIGDVMVVGVFPCLMNPALPAGPGRTWLGMEADVEAAPLGHLGLHCRGRTAI